MRTYYVHATDIAGYVFRADTYCQGCIGDVVTSDPRYDGWKVAPEIRMSVEENLDEIAAAFGIDRQDEGSFDSDNFPKVIFASQLEGGEYCAACFRDLLDEC